MTSWQPISTAPRDGTAVLIAEADGNVTACYWSTSVWADGGAWISELSRSDTVHYHPTHWMPIPPPPKDENNV